MNVAACIEHVFLPDDELLCRGSFFFPCSPQPTPNQTFAGTLLCFGRPDSMPLAEDYCHFASEASTQNGGKHTKWGLRHGALSMIEKRRKD